jgi:hypothetical protein
MYGVWCTVCVKSSFWTIFLCSVFWQLFAHFVLTIYCTPIYTFWCHRTVLACVSWLLFLIPLTEIFIVPKNDRPPPQATDGCFHIAAPCFCHQVTSPLSGRRSRGLNYKGKMHRQHIKQFNIHTQPLLLVRRAFFLTTSVFRSPATPTQVYIGKSWAVKSL